MEHETIQDLQRIIRRDQLLIKSILRQLQETNAFTPEWSELYEDYEALLADVRHNTNVLNRRLWDAAIKNK